MIDIKMNWTDDGAEVRSSIAMRCPTCGVDVEPNITHRCGNMALKPPAKPKKRKESQCKP